MPVDPAQIPPQALAMMQQSGVQGGDIAQILAQLATMSPEEVSQALAQLGVQVDPETLHDAAAQWVDQAAGRASGDDEEAEPVADDEAAEGEAAPKTDPYEGDRTRGIDPQDQEEADKAQPEEDSALPPNAQPTGYTPRPTAAMPVSGGAAMPRSVGAGPPNVSGGTMDDLVSASMMQQATGNPNASVPVGGGGNVGMPRSAGAIPNPRPSGAPNNPRMAAMIADLYRSTGGKTGKKRTPSAKPTSKA